MKRTPDPPDEFLDGDQDWPAVRNCVGEAEANLARGFFEAEGFDYRERLADCGVPGNMGVATGPRIVFFVRAHQYAAAKRALDPNAFLEDREEVLLAEPEEIAESSEQNMDRPAARRILGFRMGSAFVSMVAALMLVLVLIGTSDWFLCGIE